MRGKGGNGRLLDGCLAVGLLGQRGGRGEKKKPVYLGDGADGPLFISLLRTVSAGMRVQ